MTTQDRWLVAFAVLAILAATVGLITGHKDISSQATTSQEGSDPIPQNTPQAPQLPEINIEVKDLKDVEVPIVGLEEELQQKMEAMFVKPEESLKSVETPKLDIVSEP